MTKTRVSESNNLAPCGHTQEQATWLGCVGSRCRVQDEELSAEYFSLLRSGAIGAARRESARRNG